MKQGEKMFRCKSCGFIVKKMVEWKPNECPNDKYQHHFEKIVLPPPLVSYRDCFYANNFIFRIIYNI